MANATAMVGEIINEDPAWTLQLWNTPPTASNYAKFDLELWEVLHSIIPINFRFSGPRREWFNTQDPYPMLGRGGRVWDREVSAWRIPAYARALPTDEELAFRLAGLVKTPALE